jgi:hypothetical protein
MKKLVKLAKVGKIRVGSQRCGFGREIPETAVHSKILKESLNSSDVSNPARPPRSSWSRSGSATHTKTQMLTQTVIPFGIFRDPDLRRRHLNSHRSLFPSTLTASWAADETEMR